MDENEIYNMYDTLHSVVVVVIFCVCGSELGGFFRTLNLISPFAGEIADWWMAPIEE